MKRQNIFFISFILISALFCIAHPCHSIVEDTEEKLIVESGDSIERSGEISKSVLIHVRAGGTINVSPYDGGTNIGKLNLIAPRIIIEGSINAIAVSCNITGKGDDPLGIGIGCGGGGAGYGGKGGDGEGSPASGGITYTAQDYLEDVGSYGYEASLGGDRPGLGGGCIRLDAISLTLGATAYLDARGNTSAYPHVGGGSGGCVLLNGIHTCLESNYTIDISGGHGGPVSGDHGAAGGGGGGRIKFIKHNDYNYLVGNIYFAGGLLGGSGAGDGWSGEITSHTAPPPNSPELLSPADGQEVGRSPTFEFKATDPADSKFLKYQLVLSLDGSFTQLTFTATQLNPDVGWDKPCYASDEEASYALQFELEGGTTYYWSVSVTSNEGADWVNSGSRSFTATSNNVPCPPQLLQPSQNQIDVSTTPAFKVLGADPDGDTLTFTIVLSKYAELSISFQEFKKSYTGWDKSAYVPAGSYAGVTATCQIHDGLEPGRNYYWKAVAYDQYDQTSESDIFHFKTALTPPLAPQLIFPEDNYPAPDSQITFQFRVASESGNTLNGRLELSENNFQTVEHIFDQTREQTGWSELFYQSHNIASFTLPAHIQLERQKSYWWRAYAIDGICPGPVSGIRSFSLASVFEFQHVRTVPNPAVSTSTIQIYMQLSVDAEITIRFYNKLGKEVDQLHSQARGGAQGNIFTYDISQYASGIYFYVIEAKSAFGQGKITKRFAVIN